MSLALAALAAANALAALQPPSSPPRRRPKMPPGQERPIETPPKREEVTDPLLEPVPEPPPPKENPLSYMVSKLTIPLHKGPLFLLPLVDRYKDLGFTYGVMPIMAVRGKGETVNSVFAPSVLYNRFLKTTVTWRGYFFPDEYRMFVTRAAWSQEVDREIFLRYFDPRLFGTRYRLNAEVHWLRAGRPSFYGIGPSTKLSSQANYASHKLGEEATVDIPVWGDWFVDLHHSFFRRRAEQGPIDNVPQLSASFPTVFAAANDWKDYLFHQAAIVYDSTDHAALPRRGTYISASAGYSVKGLGSSFTYQLYGIQLKQYVNAGKGAYITAFHARLQQQTGQDLPFLAQQAVGESDGLRVVGDRRFVDRGRLIFSIEERFRISQSPFLKFVSEMELTPFIDAGTVFHDPKGFKPRNLHWAYGGAFRLVLRPQVVGTVDVVLGAEGPNFLVHVGYPF